MITATAMEDPTLFDRILVCWRYPVSGGSQVVCELGRTVAGLELRSGRLGDAVLRTAPVRNMTEAFELAARWKSAYARHAESAASPAPSTPRPSPSQPTILEQRAKYRRGGDLRRMSD